MFRFQVSGFRTLSPILNHDKVGGMVSLRLELGCISFWGIQYPESKRHNLKRLPSSALNLKPS